MTDEEAKAEGLTIDCPSCRAIEWMHPETVFEPSDRFFCGECGHDFGPWVEVHGRLFIGGAMLSELLSRPVPPTD